DLCTRLDGLPLAIELAAARVRVLPPSVIVQRLRHRLDLLSGAPHDAPARHQSLRTALDWSYDLLPETAQALFARMSVFVGGATLEAAESVCAGDGVETDAILDLLATLVENSLALSVVDAQGFARYRQLEIVRE